MLLFSWGELALCRDVTGEPRTGGHGRGWDSNNALLVTQTFLGNEQEQERAGKQASWKLKPFFNCLNFLFDFMFDAQNKHLYDFCIISPRSQASDQQRLSLPAAPEC